MKTQNSNQKLKYQPAPNMVEYHPSTSNSQQSLHKHELITINGADLNSESTEKFHTNLVGENNLSTSTNNIVTKARKLLPIHDELNNNNNNNVKLNTNISGEFTVYKSVSSFNLSSTAGGNKPALNNIDISMPANVPATRTLPKVSLVRNASQQSFNSASTTPTNLSYNINHVTQLPAIKIASHLASVPIVLNTHSFASAPSKTINFTSEPSM
jgi:hypothetical protein